MSANEDVGTEKPSRAGIQTERNAFCGRGRNDVWILEDWQRDSGTKVRLPARVQHILALSFIPLERSTRLIFLVSELAREKMWSRIHLIPLLTAEEDRDLVRRHYADQAREKELLGSQTSPYNSDRYMAPRFSHSK
jgi:hypothetical protein